MQKSEEIVANNLIIPYLGNLIDEVVLTNWLVDDGDEVELKDPVLEIETVKSNFTIDANAKGTIRIGPHPIGSTVPVLTVVATIGSSDESFSPSEQMETSESENQQATLDNMENKHITMPHANKNAKEGGLSFVAARCPQCGGELQLDSGKATAFCMHCGSKIIVQEAINAVQIDNTHMIENWMKMGDTAYEGENFSEAYEYYRKIVEIRPDNWIAIFKKGKAAGWQSTIANLRFTEATTNFAQAINQAPDNKKDELIIKINEEVKKLALALISLRADRFEKWPDADETAGFINDISEILKAAIRLGEKSGFKASGFMRPIAKKINSSVMYAWSTKIKRDYVGDDNHPTQYQFNQFIQRIGFCTQLIELSIGLSDEDDNEDNQAYKNLIILNKEAINSCSWEYAGETWLGVDYKKGYELTNYAKQARRERITEYESKISSIQSKIQRKKEAVRQERQRKIDAEIQERERKIREEAKKRKDEYWAKHSEEKQKLEDERNKITRKIIDLQEERDFIISKLRKEKLDLNARIQNSKKELDSLGVFKRKEKKELNNFISELQKNLKDIETKIKNEEQPFDAEIDRINGRINEIVDELNKQR